MGSQSPDRKGDRRRLAGIAAVALCAAVIGGGAVAGLDAVSDDGGSSPPAATETPQASEPTTPSPSSTANATAVDFSEVYTQRRPGVVSITAIGESEQSQPGPFQPPGGDQSRAAGSGVVIDKDGHIVTNEHVVSGADKVNVTFASGRTVQAKVVGTDPSTDLALLKVDLPASQLTPVPLGDSSDLEIGSSVLAIGDPFGYEASASAGIVSGLNRTIEAPNGFSINGTIQTDAAINHGNSGGALLDAQGRLIAIPAQIAASGVNANVGVGFAIPVNTVKSVVAQLKSGGNVEHAWLGVSTDTADATSKAAGVPTDSGAIITGVVTSGPAARAGVDPGERLVEQDGAPVCVGGDVVTRVDDTPIADASDLQDAVDAHKPGDRVRLTVVASNGQQRTVSVTLAKRPRSAPDTTGGCLG